MAAEALDDELNTTAPQSKPTEWKMPDPVFRRTSGKLPRGFEKQFGPSTTGEHEASSEAVEAYVEPTPKNPTLKFILVLLGIVAMIAFIAVFLTVLYFFFLRT